MNRHEVHFTELSYNLTRKSSLHTHGQLFVEADITSEILNFNWFDKGVYVYCREFYLHGMLLRTRRAIILGTQDTRVTGFSQQAASYEEHGRDAFSDLCTFIQQGANASTSGAGLSRCLW